MKKQIKLKFIYSEEITNKSIPKLLEEFILFVNNQLDIDVKIYIKPYDAEYPLGEIELEKGIIYLRLGDDSTILRDIFRWCEIYAHEARHYYQYKIGFDDLFKHYAPVNNAINKLAEIEKKHNPNLDMSACIEIVNIKYHGIQPDEIDAEVFARLSVLEFMALKGLIKENSS